MKSRWDSFAYSSFFNLVIVLGLFSATQARADVLNPLLGSPWAQANPGKLPFEECHLECDEVFLDDSISVKLVFVGFSESHKGALSLVCTAPSVHVGYKIPLYFSESGVTGGLFLSFLLTSGINRELKIKHLDGKTVGEILGSYKGVKVGGGIFIVGGAGTFLKNENDVKLRAQELEFFDVLSIQSMGVSLISRKWVSLGECIDQYVVLGDTQQSRNRTACTPYDPYDPNSPLTPVNVEALNQLKFEKIKR